jgi:hypothetical protein
MPEVAAPVPPTGPERLGEVVADERRAELALWRRLTGPT